MKKLNRTYIMGIVCLILAAWVVWQTTMIPERLVSNEPGPKLFPFISAGGIAVFAILSMIFDGPKDDGKAYLDKQGWVRLAIIMAEAVVFCVAMQFIGFWFTAMLGMFMFIWTLKGEKKINIVFAIILSIVIGSICYSNYIRSLFSE